MEVRISLDVVQGQGGSGGDRTDRNAQSDCEGIQVYSIQVGQCEQMIQAQAMSRFDGTVSRHDRDPARKHLCGADIVQRQTRRRVPQRMRHDD